MFYIFNTITARYVTNPYASALRGKDVPEAYASRALAEKEIARRDWVDEGTYTIHMVVIEENLLVDKD